MTFFFLFFGIGSIQPFVVPYLRNELGMSALKASSVIGLLYLVFGIARFFTRYLIRLIEKRNTIILGAVGYLCLPISLSLGGSYAVYMLGAALIGMGAALVWTASSVQVLDTSESKGYGAASGVMYFFVQAGISLGTIQAGVIASRTPPETRFLKETGFLVLPGLLSPLTSVGTALGSAASAWAGKSANYWGVFAASSVIGILAILAALLVPQVRSKFVDDRWSVAFRFFKRPSNWFPPAILAISFSTYGIMLTMFNQYVAATFGTWWLACFHTCYLLTGMFSTIASGRLSDRIGRTKVVTFSLLCGALGLAIFGMTRPAILGAHWLLAASTVTLFAVGAVFVGIASGAIPTVALAWVGDNSTEAERPTIHACVFAWRDFGFVGVTYLGVLLQGQNLPLQSCFLVFSAVFLAAAALSGLLLYHERSRP
jgi:MFS family permease